MQEALIHGPTINPAHPSPRATGPGLDDVISAGGDVDWDLWDAHLRTYFGSPMPPEDAHVGQRCTPLYPWAARPRGAGAACPRLPSCSIVVVWSSNKGRPYRSGLFCCISALKKKTYVSDRKAILITNERSQSASTTINQWVGQIKICQREERTHSFAHHS